MKIDIVSVKQKPKVESIKSATVVHETEATNLEDIFAKFLEL